MMVRRRVSLVRSDHGDFFARHERRRISGSFRYKPHHLTEGRPSSSRPPGVTAQRTGRSLRERAEAIGEIDRDAGAAVAISQLQRFKERSKVGSASARGVLVGPRDYIHGP